MTTHQNGKIDPSRPKYLPVVLDENIPYKGDDLVTSCLDEDEKGDARLFTSIYHNRLVYDHAAKCWYTWQGCVWRPDLIGLVRRLIAGQLATQYLWLHARLMRRANATDDEAEKKSLEGTARAARAHARALHSLKKIKNVEEFSRSFLPITGNEWDTNPWLLAVQNGVIDLRTGELLPGNPEDYLSVQAPTLWAGLDTPAPVWKQALTQIFEPTPDIVAYLQRLAGYGITGLTQEHVFPIFQGEQGRNGKSTILETWRHVLGGELAAPCSHDVLIEQTRPHGAGTATPHLLDLRGKRLVWSSETTEGEKLDAAQIKLITGGDTVNARGLYQSQVTFRPSWLILLLTNHIPRASSTDDALWNRLHLIPFNMRFVDDPQKPNERPRDPALSEVLQAEASGILAWLVRGCLQWQKEGLNPPDVVKLATQQYRENENPLKGFLEDCCVFGEQFKAPAKAIYEAYQQWCRETGVKYPLNGKRFGELLARKFPKQHTFIGNFYMGVGLLAAQHEGSEGTEGISHEVPYREDLHGEKSWKVPSEPSAPSATPKKGARWGYITDLDGLRRELQFAAYSDDHSTLSAADELQAFFDGKHDDLERAQSAAYRLGVQVRFGIEWGRMV